VAISESSCRVWLIANYYLLAAASPVIELRSIIRIRVRPVFAVLLAKCLLFRCQQLPIMDRVRLLHYPYKRRRLAFAYVLADFTHLGQAAAEVVAPVAKVEFSADVNHISFVEFRHSAGIALTLNRLEAAFTGASFVGSREGAAGFGAAMFLRHDFHSWQSLAISAIFGNF
jgi:hypothetical protein